GRTRPRPCRPDRAYVLEFVPWSGSPQRPDLSPFRPKLGSFHLAKGALTGAPPVSTLTGPSTAADRQTTLHATRASARGDRPALPAWGARAPLSRPGSALSRSRDGRRGEPRRQARPPPLSRPSSPASSRT